MLGLTPTALALKDVLLDIYPLRNGRTPGKVIINRMGSVERRSKREPPRGGL